MISESVYNFDQYSRNIISINKDLPFEFRTRLKYLRKQENLTREKLSELSYISEQTIKQIENDEKRGYSLETIISLCIGLKLPPELSISLIESGGYCMNYSASKSMIAYNFILRNLYNESIDYINEFLKQNKLKPLTDNYK